MLPPVPAREVSNSAAKTLERYEGDARRLVGEIEDLHEGIKRTVLVSTKQDT